MTVLLQCYSRLLPLLILYGQIQKASGVSFTTPSRALLLLSNRPRDPRSCDWWVIWLISCRRCWSAADLRVATSASRPLLVVPGNTRGDKAWLFLVRNQTMHTRQINNPQCLWFTVMHCVLFNMLQSLFKKNTFHKQKLLLSKHYKRPKKLLLDIVCNWERHNIFTLS